MIDNAEGKGTHIHRYEGTRKLPAQPFHQGSAREGVPAVRDFLASMPAISSSMAKRPLGAAAEQALGAMDTEMLSETHRWPDGAVVIPSDLPEFGVAVADAVEGMAPFVLVFPDGQEIMFRPTPQATGDIDLSSTLDALRKLGPLTSPHVPVDLQAYGVSVAATSGLYEPPVAA